MADEALLQQNLRERVERFLGIAMNSKRDFETLSVEIFKHKKILISPSTLRRFWGYQEQGSHTTSTTTLDTLSRLIGYWSWTAFCNDGEALADSSEMLSSGKTIMTENLEVGTQITVCWKPSRMVLLEFIGGDVYRVMENTNSKLQVGDTFHCKMLTEGMPLHCEGLLRTGCALMNYVGGKDGGISFHEKPLPASPKGRSV